MKKRVKLSIIYVYFNTPKELVDSISTIKDAISIKNYEEIVVNNNSPKDLPKMPHLKKIKVIKSKRNLGFGAGCNLGAKKASGKYLLFINPDTIFKKSSIDILLKKISSNKNIGVVGPKMVSEAGKTLPTTSTFISPFNALFKFSFLGKFLTKNVVTKGQTDVLSGACLLIKKNVFEEVEGFDENFFMYFEEQDLCKRIADLGYKIVYEPKSQITHFIGRSLSNKKTIEEYFRTSRYKYTKKHFGNKKAAIIEFILRNLSITNVAIFVIFCLSLFLNTFRMSELMLLIGDSARDFIAGQAMIETGKIPLVGIPSSVTWLHQGPISVWLIGLSFLFSNTNPVAPGYLFGFLGAISTALVYLLGKTYFNKRVGVLSALLFATAPMITVNSRMPYHTSLIPLFTLIFFLVLHKSISKTKLLPLMFFFLGILLQVELSNIVVLGLVFITLRILKIHASRLEIVKSIIGFITGISPFILYDLTHGFSYSLFPLWILNRLRLFAGIGTDNAPTSSGLPNAINTFYHQISASIFPNIPYFGLVIFIVSLIILAWFTYSKRSKGNLLLLLWITVPSIAFLLHASPGTAYFALLYPAISLTFGFFLDKLTSKTQLSYLFIAAIVASNVFLLIKNDFYVTSKNGPHLMPPSGYSFGNTWVFVNETSHAIVGNAAGKEFKITPLGFLNEYKTSMDPYKFLITRAGGKLNDKAKINYLITVEGITKDKSKIIYSNFQDQVERHESK